MTHDQVRQMVRRINPIPDPNVLEPVDAPVLEMERSMDMQVDERPMAQERPENRWRAPVIGIAAAVVVLMGGLIYATTNEDDVAAPAPNATQVPLDFEPMEPGAYYTDTRRDVENSTRGTFVIEGEGWVGLESGALKDPEGDDVYVSLMIVEVEEVYETVCAMSGRGPVAAETTAAGLADQFASNGFIVREAIAPVTAFGHDGYKLVMEVPAGCADDLDQAWNGGVFQGRYYQAEGQVLEYWFLDVGGTAVMVEASWFPDSSDADIAELREVLDTLVITP